MLYSVILIRVDVLKVIWRAESLYSYPRRTTVEQHKTSKIYVRKIRNS